MLSMDLSVVKTSTIGLVIQTYTLVMLYFIGILTLSLSLSLSYGYLYAVITWLHSLCILLQHKLNEMMDPTFR